MKAWAGVSPIVVRLMSRCWVGMCGCVVWCRPVVSGALVSKTRVGERDTLHHQRD